MPRVRVEPGGFDLDVMAGETVAEAAWRLGYTWPTQCYGQADCMVCRVRVIAGDEAAAPADDDELDRMRTKLPQHLLDPRARLACRLSVVDDGLVVEKKGVRSPGGEWPPPRTDLHCERTNRCR
jgi:2Fe-2S ferredoxin